MAIVRYDLIASAVGLLLHNLDTNDFANTLVNLFFTIITCILLYNLYYNNHDACQIFVFDN